MREAQVPIFNCCTNDQRMLQRYRPLPAMLYGEIIILHYAQKIIVTQALDVMHIRGMVEILYSSMSHPMRSRITGVILIDATGKRYEVSMDFAKSYEVRVYFGCELKHTSVNNIQIFTKSISLFFDGDRMEAKIQRRYMEQGRFDLCIQQGNRVVPIGGQRDWSKVKPGTELVMRAMLSRYRKRRNGQYECPRCKTGNDPDGGGGNARDDLWIEW